MELHDLGGRRAGGLNGHVIAVDRARVFLALCISERDPGTQTDQSIE